MNLGEIIRESWGVYKRNFLTLVIPFFVLSIAISVVFSFISTGGVTSHFEESTVVIAGKNLSSPNLLDDDDENYFEVRGDENHGLEILHDSQAIPEIRGRWIQVCLNFASSVQAIYHLDIYNFSENSWENGGLAKVEAVEVYWAIERTVDVENYLSDENFIRIRVKAENTEVICREDSLEYRVIQSPEFAKTLIEYLVPFLGLTFCCGIAIGTTQQAMSKKRVKLGDALRTVGGCYPRMLVATLIIVITMMGFLYLILSSAWGIFIIIPAGLFLLFCAYTWQGVVIRSLSPWSSIRSSFKVTWQNLGTTVVLCLLLVLVWFFIGPSIPIIGTLVVYIFLPLWAVALSVTYMDWAGKLLQIQKNEND